MFMVMASLITTCQLDISNLNLGHLHWKNIDLRVVGHTPTYRKSVGRNTNLFFTGSDHKASQKLSAKFWTF